jgi:SAM-dependent methyltransferase
MRSQIRKAGVHLSQQLQRRATRQWLHWHPELALPIPPLEMRQLVGPTDAAAFDNPNLDLVYPYLPQEAYTAVFDFGCGCGRIARQLLQQIPRPRRYVGIDLHRGMIKWCSDNLAPAAPHFEFQHHDVFNLSFNPGTDKLKVRPFPVEDRAFTLVNAWSVFTHVLEDAAKFYLHQCSRIMSPDGILNSTWFTFDKRDFPMMQESQNAIFINDIDPTNAVIFDRAWLRRSAAEAGLSIVNIVPPAVRGFAWIVLMAPRSAGRPEVEFPVDSSAAGIVRAPIPPLEAHQIGLGEP